MTRIRAGESLCWISRRIGSETPKGTGMCGIGGIADLGLQRQVPKARLARVAACLRHRGPDEQGFYAQNGLGLASCRLSIVGVRDGQQPLFNEDRSVVAVFNGELFDHVEQRERLTRRGHRLRSSTDSEILVHLWEEYGEDMFCHIHGQFAFALFDIRQRLLILARDRVGICPLYWSNVDGWLLFGSEIKAILSSGHVAARPDLRGLDSVVTFFCMPGRRTPFEGIQSLPPGGWLKVDLGAPAGRAQIRERIYWDFNFPDAGQEVDARNESQLVARFDEVLEHAVRIRLRADVPVAAYLSGGVDSSLIAAKFHQLHDGRFATFTARIGERSLDESDAASHFARLLQTEHHTVDCGRDVLSANFPRVVEAADSPVVDPNAGSLYQLSRSVRDAGFKVVLSGEGADEALAGYVWQKVLSLAQRLSWRRLRPFHHLFRGLFHTVFRKASGGTFERINQTTGGLHAQMLVYHLTSGPRWLLLADDVRKEMEEETAYDQLRLDTERIRRWHPLNQSLYFGYKTHLPGLLLNHRGDRTAMANGVEVRYPFLDEGLIALCASLHPRWKLRGLNQDKYLLRVCASRHLPRDMATRRKAMFRAPFTRTFLSSPEPYVGQLLSRQSLDATPYFSTKQTLGLIRDLRRGLYPPPLRLFAGMAVCTVLGIQLWHHMYLGGDLCELPAWQPPEVPAGSLERIRSVTTRRQW